MEDNIPDVGGGAVIVATTLIVGASDCKDQNRADYKPDGTADQTEINAAINALPT